MYPHERSLVKRLAGKPFALLGVNSDADRGALKKTLVEEGLSWPSWWDGGSPQGKIASHWNVRGWPTTYLIDAHGVIRDKGVIGEQADHAIDALLEELARETR
jgi:hypothetical protein